MGLQGWVCDYAFGRFSRLVFDEFFSHCTAGSTAGVSGLFDQAVHSIGSMHFGTLAEYEGHDFGSVAVLQMTHTGGSGHFFIASNHKVLPDVGSVFWHVKKVSFVKNAFVFFIINGPNRWGFV